MKTIARLALAAMAAVSFAAFAAVSLGGEARAEKVIRAAVHADLKNIDPIWTTAYITRNHGYMIYDTLFALDENLEVRPQMVETWSLSEDGLTWRFTLRDGLRWHDGAPVTAADCVASIRRWEARDGMGQKLADATAEKIKAQGIHKIGLLGTSFTMEEDFYAGRLAGKHGLEVLIPGKADRQLVHDVIYDELCLGITKDGSRDEYRRIIAALVESGLE